MSGSGSAPHEKDSGVEGLRPAPGATAGERPLLFLDVDGVLNCIGRNQEGYDHHRLRGIPVWVPPGTVERVGKLLTVFDLVWATAWLGSAAPLWRRVLRLGEASWPYVDYSDLKLPAILRAAGERRWAWVDDDADWELRKLGWDRDMLAGLVVAPDPEVGMTDSHVTELLDFGNQAEGSCAPKPITESRRDV